MHDHTHVEFARVDHVVARPGIEMTGTMPSALLGLGTGSVHPEAPKPKSKAKAKAKAKPEGQPDGAADVELDDTQTEEVLTVDKW